MSDKSNEKEYKRLIEERDAKVKLHENQGDRMSDKLSDEELLEYVENNLPETDPISFAIKQQIVEIIKLSSQKARQNGEIKKSEITEGLIEEKARELFEKGILYHKDTENQAILPLDWCKDFIRKLYEEMPVRAGVEVKE